MRIEIEGCGDCRVSEPLLGDLWMNAGQQELRRVAVAKVVEPDAREVGSEPGKEAWKFMRQALRLQRCAITTGTSEHIPGVPTDYAIRT